MKFQKMFKHHAMMTSETTENTVRLRHFGITTKDKSPIYAEKRRRVGEIIANGAPTQANKNKTNRQGNINEIQRDTTKDLLGGHRSCLSQPFDTIKKRNNKS